MLVFLWVCLRVCACLCLPVRAITLLPPVSFCVAIVVPPAGLTYEEVAARFPSEYKARQADKLGYRYPGGGESYIDIIERVKPLLLELERIRDSVVIVAHQAVLRTLLGTWPVHSF